MNAANTISDGELQGKENGAEPQRSPRQRDPFVSSSTKDVPFGF